MRRAAVVASLLLAAACVGGGDDGGPVEHGSVSLDVVAPAVGGGDVDFAGYAGRDLIVWFWSPW